MLLIEIANFRTADMRFKILFDCGVLSYRHAA
jgi:hypothetical protein